MHMFGMKGTPFRRNKQKKREVKFTLPQWVLGKYAINKGVIFEDAVSLKCIFFRMHQGASLQQETHRFIGPGMFPEGFYILRLSTNK